MHLNLIVFFYFNDYFFFFFHFSVFFNDNILILFLMSVFFHAVGFYQVMVLFSFNALSLLQCKEEGLSRGGEESVISISSAYEEERYTLDPVVPPFSLWHNRTSIATATWSSHSISLILPANMEATAVDVWSCQRLHSGRQVQEEWHATFILYR